MQTRLPQSAEEPEDAAPKESPELKMEPSARLDHSSANKVVGGSLATPTTAEAPSLQSLPLGDLASSNLTLGSANRTAESSRKARSNGNSASRSHHALRGPRASC